MPNTDLEIKNIQFKRGKKAVLEEKLVAGKLGVPKSGEPIYETDTRKLKIGDGKTSYKDLPYYGGNGSDVDIPNFIIQDPLSNQILLYDESLQAWVNKDLADDESIIYLAERGLTIKGYDTAEQGYMLVKDSVNGLTWVEPVNITQLNNAVGAAETAKTDAKNYAQTAGNSAAEASKAAGNADRINQQTMNWVNEKFWWGSLEEYNQHIQENGLNPGTFYFVTPEK
jgi:hypothetical protein